MTRIAPLLALFALACAPGADGVDGTDGQDGTNGIEGSSGVDGQNGTNGANGVDGQNGADGVNGVDGQNGSDGVDGSNGADGAAGTSVGVLGMSFSGLSNLGPDAAYEGWIIVDGAPVSTGVFHVDDDGFQTQSTFLARQSDIDAATTFVLTLEPVPDLDPAPSATHILGGDFNGDLAVSDVGHPAALGNDYLDTEGTFVLTTPTTVETDDNQNGIWWLAPAEGGPVAGLTNLPDLTDTGWRYEGWVVGPNGPISTGVFAHAGEMDSDAAGGVLAGPNGVGPSYPGQDFINPRIDLTTGFDAVLTIEPFPDTSPAPFTALKPLAGPIGMGLAPSLQFMDNTAGSFPIGTVTR